jgi:hypothetical protein
MAMDPADPSLIYASFWDFRREAHTFRSGGPGSGIYRSQDGGTTWNKIHNGLPAGTLGRIALAVSPVAPHTLSAGWNLKNPPSTDLQTGDTGEKMSDLYMMGDRPFLLQPDCPDPVEKERVYKPGTTLWVCTDGGKVFQSLQLRGQITTVIPRFWVSHLNNRFMYLGTCRRGIHLL